MTLVLVADIEGSRAMEMVDETRHAQVQREVVGFSEMYHKHLNFQTLMLAHEQKRAQMVVERVGEVLKAVLVRELALAQLFVSELGIFGDRRHSKATSRIFRSVIIILP